MRPSADGVPDARPWHRPPGARPWVLAHRGARLERPENTLAAFERARELGADGVELDVRLSADGVPVVVHDPSLKRLVEGADTTPVSALDSQALARRKLAGGEPIPTLAEVLAWARATHQRLNIELKHDLPRRALLIRAVVGLLRAEPDAAARLLLSSFYPPFVVALARALPHVPSAWLVHAGQRWLRRARGWRLLGAAGVHAEARLICPELVDRVRGRGGFVSAWTVNAPDDAVRLSRLGVDTLISDDPAAILAAVGGVPSGATYIVQGSARTSTSSDQRR